MNSELLEKVKIKYIIPIAIIIWVLAFTWAIVVMGLIGFDYENETMGIDHEQYWEFEVLMTPAFIIIGLLFLSYYFLKSDIPAEEWKTEGVVSGVIVMAIQFILDQRDIFLDAVSKGPIDYIIDSSKSDSDTIAEKILNDLNLRKYF